jgi:hypothetical protein
MSLGPSHVIQIDTMITSPAYAPVLLERKAMAIRRQMDQEKASEVVVRTSMNTVEKQYVYIIVYIMSC